MRPLGLNILSDGADPVNETEAINMLRDLRPHACVVDSFKLYKTIRDHVDQPVRLPILRVINRDDAEWAKKVSPAAWVEMMQPVMNDGAVVLQCLNEPAGYVDLKPLASWIADVVHIVPSHVTLVVANFAVFNPDIARVEAGEFDVAIKAIAGTRHYLGIHEYFYKSADEQTNRISRFRVFDRRTDALGLARLNIVAGEFGRDVGGGQGRGGDGWKNSGLTAEQYVSEVKAAVRDVYTARRPAVPVCIFSYGSGFDVSDNEGADLGRAWESFDIRGNEYIMQQLGILNTELNAPTGLLPPPPSEPVEWTARRIKTASGVVNMREKPSTDSTILGKLQGDKVIDVKYNVVADVKEGAHTWRQYEIAGQVVYIRSDAAELLSEPVTPPPPVVMPPEPPNANITFTAAELSAMQNSLQVVYERNKAFIAHAEAALAELKTANDEIANVRLVLADAMGRAKRAA